MALFGLLTLPLPLIGQETASSDSDSTALNLQRQEHFEKHIRPTLIEHCERCHGQEKQQGGLRLDVKEGWKIGGDSGPAIIAGDMESLLLEAIRYESGIDMPPKGKLPDSTIKAFENWIELGAFDPRISSSKDSTSEDKAPRQVDRSFWSFQPVTTPDVPNPLIVEDWATSKIDHFILNELHKKELEPAPIADRETLIRRLHYDLTGLPPSVDDITAFVNDTDTNAWEKLVDRLLEQPAFGERWGRHWLDVVRFAESSGGGRTLLFPDAWRYRDYVIESFNRDTPYDQFIIEQIAGDLLTSNDHLERQRQLIATGFLLLGPTNYEMQDKDILEMDVVDEQLDTIGKSMMGMTIGCARCHDHKFDPIPTADYYALAGILKSTHSLIHSNVSTWNKVDLPLNENQEALIAEQESELAKLEEHLKSTQTRLDNLQGNSRKPKQISIDSINAIVLDDVDATRTGSWKESTSISGYVGQQYIHDENMGLGKKSVTFEDAGDAIGTYRLYISHTPGSNRCSKVAVKIHHLDGETDVIINQRPPGPIHHSFTELGTFTFSAETPAKITITNQTGQDGVVIADSIVLAPSEQTLDQTFPTFASTKSPKLQQEIESLKSQLTGIEQEIKSHKQAAITRPVAMAVSESQTLGDIEIAIRGVISQKGERVRRDVLSAAKWEPFQELDESRSGRLELAQWIADPQNPLTARVMANRIWYWMMGRGLVRSLDNFGSTGTEPSHPELLDHLANRFIEENWSIKSLIKTIALSSTYRQASSATKSSTADPDNQLYHRANRKRLRAEDIRDTLLTIGKTLDTARGGPSIKAGTKIEYDYQFESRRRSVYLPVFRNTLPEVFEVFDFADPNIQQGKRNESTVASQALWLMNHPLILDQTRNAAKAILSLELNTEKRIELAFLQTLGRFPSKLEAEIMEQLTESTNDTAAGAPPNEQELDQWTMVYQTLCQSVDFLYVN